MKKILIRLLAGSMLAAGSLAAGAATMDITASFTPSVSNPENNTFTNTTPLSGFCADWPTSCTNNNTSISFAGITLLGNGVLLSDDSNPKNHFYLGLPGATKVDVVNSETQEKAQITFTITGFGGRWTNLGSGARIGWERGEFAYPTNLPCGSATNGASIGTGSGSDSTWYGWAWNVSGACYKRSTYTGRTITSSNLYQTSIRYKLVTPNPLQLTSGIYKGYVDWSIGPGGDIDFGNKWDASDSTLRVNFTLSVNHELKLSATADNQQVSLQPCASGKVCTAEDGAANWERWMITRATPELTGRSNFNLSSSGAFTVYMECEQQSGSDCALKSDNTPSQTVPVQSLLTLPRGIVDSSTGSTVTKRRLAVGRDLTKNVFVTKSFAENQAGSIDFLVSQKDVDTMLKTRPDTYRGAVTVIFDPKIY